MKPWWDMGPFKSQECAFPGLHLPMWDNDPRSTYRGGGELGLNRYVQACEVERAGDRFIGMQGLVSLICY